MNNSKTFGNQLANLIIDSHKADPSISNPTLQLVRVIEEFYSFNSGGYSRIIRTGMVKLMAAFVRSSNDLEGVYDSDRENIGFAFDVVMTLLENMNDYFTSNQWEEVNKTLEKEGINIYHHFNK